MKYNLIMKTIIIIIKYIIIRNNCNIYRETQMKTFPKILYIVVQYIFVNITMFIYNNDN